MIKCDHEFYEGSAQSTLYFEGGCPLCAVTILKARVTELEENIRTQSAVMTKWGMGQCGGYQPTGQGLIYPPPGIAPSEEEVQEDQYTSIAVDGEEVG